MVKAYTKIIFRQLKSNISRFLAMFAISILGIAFITGLLATAPNMEDSVDAYFDEYNMQDITIKKELPFTNEDLEKIESNEYVDKITPIFAYDVMVNSKATRLYKLNFASEDLMQLNIISGRLPENEKEIVVEREGTYLETLSIDSTISILGTTYTVVGISRNPLFFGNTKETTNIGAGKLDLIIYQKDVTNTIYTDVLVTVKNAKVLNTFSRNYDSLIKNAKISLEKIDDSFYILDRMTNQGFVSYKENVNTISSIATVFPFYFVLISTLVVLTTMTRMIDEERGMIGILKALGYSNSKIRFKYIFFALLPTFIGVIGGLLAGFQVLPRMIYSIFGSTYFTPDLQMGFYLETSLLASLLMVSSIIIATLISINQKLRNTPAKLLVPKAPKAGKRVFLEKVTFLWKRLSFKYKASIRNVFRHKKHLVMTLIGISGCVALLFTGFGLKGAIDGISSVQYEEIVKYELDISVTSISDELKTYLGSENNYLESYEKTEYLNIDDEDILTTVFVFTDQDLNKVHDFINIRERESSNQLIFEDGIIITEGLAKYKNLNTHDYLKIDNHEYEITGIAENYLNNYIYISESVYQDEFKTTNLLVRNKNIEDLSKELKTLLDITGVVSVSNTIDSKKMYERVSEQLNLIILIIIVSASALAMIVTYNLNNVNIEERKKEIATLKVLGYHSNEVSGYIYRETAIQTFFGIGLGIGLGFLFERFIISLVDGATMMLGRGIPWYTYVFSILITIILTIVVAFIMYPKIKKIDMNSSLKVME